jgi:hypothetical protein
MKKLLVLILIPVSVFACKTTKTAATHIDERTQTEISLESSRQRETGSEVSSSSVLTQSGQTEIDVLDVTVKVELSAPDAAGNQYPTFITYNKKETGIKSKNSDSLNVETRHATSLQEKSETQIRTKSNEQRTKTEKTVSDKGACPLAGKGKFPVAFVCVAVILIFWLVTELKPGWFKWLLNVIKKLFK